MKPAPRLQILDWGTNFENFRSRTVSHCIYVCTPNKQHGTGFLRIMAEPDGAAIYGIWGLIVGACSQHKERDGWLTNNGKPDGEPWTAQDLAWRWHRPAQEIQRALDFISSPAIGWMAIRIPEQESPISAPNGYREDGQPVPSGYHSGTEVVLEGKGREGNRREGNEESLAAAGSNGEALVPLNGKPPKAKHKGQEVEFPSNLRSAAFRAAWMEWESYRIESKKRLTASTIKKQLADLEKLGPDEAIRRINRSIANGWQGLVFQDENRNGASGDVGTAGLMSAMGCPEAPIDAETIRIATGREPTPSELAIIREQQLQTAGAL